MTQGLKPIHGRPGIGAVKQATHRKVFRGGFTPKYLPFGRVIDGTKSRDAGNTGAINIIRPGTLMGKVTSSGKYAPAVIGATGAAYSSGTSLTLASAAVGTEIVRRIGTSGTFRITGPAVAGGPVQSEVVTYSGISSATVTVTALVNDYVSGSFIGDTDGSYLPVTFIPDGWGVDVTDSTGTSEDQEFENFPVGGIVDSPYLLPWPSEASLKQWIADCLKDAGGQFVFDHMY